VTLLAVRSPGQLSYHGDHDRISLAAHIASNDRLCSPERVPSTASAAQGAIRFAAWLAG
jgi:hypothetical protein